MMSLSIEGKTVLRIIKEQGPISVREITKKLDIEDKRVRNAIDQARAKGEMIWHDPSRGGFWWKNDRDRRPGANWKRKFGED